METHTYTQRTNTLTNAKVAFTPVVKVTNCHDCNIESEFCVLCSVVLDYVVFIIYFRFQLMRNFQRKID